VEQLSGYEIAQQRIEQRQRKRYRVGAWITLCILSGIFLLLGGIRTAGCAVPLLVSFAFFAFMDGIQLYFASVRRAPSPETVADEMNWLFGDDWRDIAGTQEFMLAQERIRKRRVRKAYFFLNVVAFFLGNTALFLLMASNAASGTMNCLLLFAIGWLVIMGGHGLMALPTRRRLARQESKFGQAVLAEMQRSTPDIGKRKEKPKNDVQYRIGEDGELEEVKYEFTFDEDDKPKRSDSG
jgi:hypothetical protein